MKTKKQEIEGVGGMRFSLLSQQVIIQIFRQVQGPSPEFHRLISEHVRR